MFRFLTQGQKITLGVSLVCGICASFLFVYYSYTPHSPESPIVETPIKTDASVCETFLGGELVEEGVLLPLLCDVSLSAQGPTITIAISKEGELSVTRNGATIFSPQDEWFREATFLDFDETKALPMSIVLQDVTYDGYLDIALSPSVGAYQRGYDYFPYDPEKGSFQGDSLLTATEAFIQVEDRTIRSLTKGRGLGDIYTASIYHFENGKYELVWEQIQVWEESTDRKVREFQDGMYVRDTRKRVNGKMVMVERVEFLEEEVEGFGEFGEWK